jgi:hypothetical protein
MVVSEEGTSEKVARAEARLTHAGLELEIARATCARIETELRLAEDRLAVSEMARISLEARLAERDQYVQALHGSRGWKLLQGLRSIFGRRW